MLMFCFFIGIILFLLILVNILPNLNWLLCLTEIIVMSPVVYTIITNPFVHDLIIKIRKIRKK